MGNLKYVEENKIGQLHSQLDTDNLGSYIFLLKDFWTFNLRK